MSSSNAVTAIASACIAGAVSTMGIWFSRRSAREANRSQQRLTDFQVLKGTVDALRSEAEELRVALADTRKELDAARASAHALSEELDAAQHNVLVLSNHIRRFMPERPFPRLREMNVGIRE